MAIYLHIQIDAINPTDGSTVVLRATNHNLNSCTALGGNTWLPVLRSVDDLEMRFFSGDFSGDTAAQVGSMRLRATSVLNDTWATYVTDGCRLQVWASSIEGEVPSDTTKIFDGLAGVMSRQLNEYSIEMKSPAKVAENAVQTSTYAGTGGAEGPSQMKGKVKPYGIGFCQNVEPVLVDAAKQIYHVSTAATALLGVFENGISFNYSGSNYATYALMDAAAGPPQGEYTYTVDPSLGLFFRLGAEPAGLITCDFTGDLGGSATAGAAVKKLLDLGGMPAWRYVASRVTDFDTAVSNVTVNQYFTDETRVSDAISTIMTGLGGYYGFDELGLLFMGLTRFGSSSATLDHARTTEPVVKRMEQLPTSSPVWRLKLNAERVWRVHNSDEISDALKTLGNDALTAAQAAQADADAALASLNNIGADGWLTRVEKQAAKEHYQAITDEYTNLVSSANTYGLTALRDAYTTAKTNLDNYLATLSPVWNDTTQDTAITRSTWIGNWAGYYTARQNLVNSLGADWSSTVVNVPSNLASLVGTEAIRNAEITDRIFSDDILDEGEKRRNFSRLYSDLESRYADLKARADALTISTTALDTARTDWQTMLANMAVGSTELVDNGNFATDTVWLKEAGWTISGGVASASAASGTDIEQVIATGLTNGDVYEIVFAVSNYSAGTVVPALGGGTASSFGTVVNANGVYSQVIANRNANTTLRIKGDSGFTGDIENVSMKRIVPWNDAQEDTLIIDEKVMGAWPDDWALEADTELRRKGPYWEITDNSTTLYGRVMEATALPSEIAGTKGRMSFHQRVKKDSIPRATRFPMFLFQVYGGAITNNVFVSLDTQTGETSVTGTNHLGGGALDLGDEWLVWGTVPRDSANTTWLYYIYSARGASAVWSASVAVTGQPIEVRAPVFTEGSADKLGREMLRARQYAYSAEMAALAQAISARDAQLANWPDVTGNGRPSDNAGTTLTLSKVGVGSLLIQGNNATRNDVGGSAWDTNVISSELFVGTAFASFQLPVTGPDQTMAGLTDNPAGTSYTDLDYAFYNNGAGVWEIRESGASAQTVTADGNSRFLITYDGVKVRYYVSGTLVREVTTTSGRTFYFGGALAHEGSSIREILFGPFSTANWSNIGGTGRPADNATVGASWGGNLTGRPVELTDGRVGTALSSLGRVAGQRRLPAISAMNLGYKFTGAITYTSAAGSPATATISVTAGSCLIGSDSVSYNAMNVNTTGTGGTNVTYQLYVDDPNFAGGTKTLVATTSGNAVYQNDGRVWIGSVTVAYPSSGTGGGSGGGGGGFCVSAFSFVETRNRGWVEAWRLIPGDELRVLSEDGAGGEWAAMESIEFSDQPQYLVRAQSGICLTVSSSTPVTLRDGSTILVSELDGQKLGVFDPVSGFRWEPCFAEPTSEHEVAHVHVGGRTFLAGNLAGTGIFTHNQSKP